jgi:hypothetical protein
MLREKTIGALLGTLLVIGGCDNSPVSPSTDRPVLAQSPADGNDNKTVLTFGFDVPVTCPNGQTLESTFEGWTQILLFQQASNPNVELNIFHAVRTFVNTAGETFVFRDVGPDHYYMEGGDLIVTVTGRATASGVIGHVVFNLNTGEAELVAGREFGDIEALACNALT